MTVGRWTAALLSAGLLGSAAITPESPRDGETSRPDDLQRAQEDNVRYDGRFTFARIRYSSSLGGRRGFFGGRSGPQWRHDYPRAEKNFMRILDETTTLDPYLGGGNVFAADDPELFKHPLAYLVEAGYWDPSDAEVRSLREWLEKGGFLIVDDFRGRDWYNFEAQMKRVLPGSRLVELTVEHPIFHSFFEIESLDLAPPTYPQYRPEYYGIFEDNDRDARLMVVVNYNNDVGDYWEWSDMGYVPIDLSNEAYKLGVNYVIYGMTH